MEVVYLPSALYYLWLAVRARSLFFFSAANPGIENGGMTGESKWTLYQAMPRALQPHTILVLPETYDQDLSRQISEAGLGFPLVGKPIYGGRGWRVQLLHNEAELAEYRRYFAVPFMLQAYVDYPVEVSVFYYRYPDQSRGRVFSLTGKELLHVTGNGRDSLAGLAQQKDRAYLQMDALLRQSDLDWARIPASGERVLLVPYGNHCRGAMFINWNAHIDDALNRTFDEVSDGIEGFFYGRFDIRCQSLEELKAGRNFKILELNGVGAEPAHIYDPGYSFWQAQRDLLFHFATIWKIGVFNHVQRGVPYLSLREAKAYLQRQKRYIANAGGQ